MPAARAAVTACASASVGARNVAPAITRLRRGPTNESGCRRASASIVCSTVAPSGRRRLAMDQSVSFGPVGP